MKNLIIVARSRTYLYSIQKILNRNGVETIIINTPKSLGSTCGLSIKTNIRDLFKIKKIFTYFEPDGIAGVFVESNNYGHLQYEKIY